MRKRGMLNFVWLFALIAGASILLLAIYGANRGIDQKGYEQSTELARAFSVVLGSSGAGLTDYNSIRPIVLRNEIKLENSCSDVDFGKNSLTVSLKSKGGDWEQEGLGISMENQYVFSSTIESKKFSILSFPFEYPFKVADILLINSEEENFCLKNAPTEIEKQVRLFPSSNWFLEEEECPEDAKTVCFQNSLCDINVYGTCSSDCESRFDEGWVNKGEEKLYYIDGLLYAAILSEKRLYDCNVNRLIYRTAELSQILSEKAALMNARGCSTSLQTDLAYWSDLIATINPEDLTSKNVIAKTFQKKADEARCKVW